MTTFEIPKGYIMLWVGEEDKIPSGWSIYDTEKDELNILAKVVTEVNPYDQYSLPPKEAFRLSLDGKRTFVIIKQ